MSSHVTQKSATTKTSVILRKQGVQLRRVRKEKMGTRARATKCRICHIFFMVSPSRQKRAPSAIRHGHGVCPSRGRVQRTQMTGKDTFFLWCPHLSYKSYMSHFSHRLLLSKSQIHNACPSHVHTLQTSNFFAAFFYLGPIAHHDYLLSHHLLQILRAAMRKLCAVGCRYATRRTGTTYSFITTVCSLWPVTHLT